MGLGGSAAEEPLPFVCARLDSAHQLERVVSHILVCASPAPGHVNPMLTIASPEETQREVGQAIESLPPAFEEVIVLREFEDLSYQEIADVLQCPVGTVMSRLGRARDKLWQALLQWQTERKLHTGVI